MKQNRYFKMMVYSYFLLSITKVAAQQTDTTRLPRLLQIAESNYPLLKSKKLDVQAAQKGVDVSRSSGKPTLDASYQMNYATYNNITGMAYPQLLIPISGPPSSGNTYEGVFGSATSLLLNWQPVTFGQRKAQVAAANAGLQYADADARNEIFQHKIKVINAYLDVLTADELVKVNVNNLERSKVNLQSVQSLVISGIRPGVDTALLRAEVSRSTIELLNARKMSKQSYINLAQLLATDERLSLTDTIYFTRLPATDVTTDSISHPLLNLFKSTVDISLFHKNALSKTMMPTLGVWGTTYARGSGISYNGAVKATDGLGFQRYNYGVGFQLSVPILQYARIKPQLQQQDFLIQSGQEKLNEIDLQLKKQRELADITINNALSIVQESPLLLKSAKFTYNAIQSRYQAGLATISDLVQAQYGLVKAETDYKLTFMGVWKALLYKAAVNGDLNLFINQVNYR